MIHYAGKRKTATNSLAFNITYWNIYPIPCNRRSKNCYISVLFYAKNITTAGAHIISESETMSDYIGGHLVLSGVFTTMLGGLTGVIAFLLAAGIFILFLVCLVTLVSSCLLFQKRKLQVDAWMKLIIFVIFSILSWLLFQSVWITLLLIIPAVLGMMTLLKNKE